MYQFKSYNTPVGEKLVFGGRKSPSVRKTLSKTTVHEGLERVPVLGKPPVTWKTSSPGKLGERPTTNYFNRRDSNLALEKSIPQTQSSEWNDDNRLVHHRVGSETFLLNINKNDRLIASYIKSDNQETNLSPSNSTLKVSDQREVNPLSARVSELSQENMALKVKVREGQKKGEELERRLNETSRELQELKTSVRQERVQSTQNNNAVHKLEADLLIVSSRLKEKEEYLSEITSKENKLKQLVVTMSQEKTLLNNRISEMLEAKAQGDKEDALQRMEHTKAENNSQNLKTESSQEVAYLKNRISEILDQHEAGSLQVHYEHKMMAMEKEIHQLKARYVSPEAIFQDPLNTLNTKSVLQDKAKQIRQLRQIISQQQIKISQLNKDSQEQQMKSARSSTAGHDVEAALVLVKGENKALRKVVESCEEKVRYLIQEGKKKDQFLKEYFNATIPQGEQKTFIEEFFRKYEVEIDPRKLHSVLFHDSRKIEELETQVSYLQSKCAELLNK